MGRDEHEQKRDREAGGRRDRAMALVELIESHGGEMMLEEIVVEVAELSMERVEVEEMLVLLKREGLVYEPQTDTYGTV